MVERRLSRRGAGPRTGRHPVAFAGRTVGRRRSRRSSSARCSSSSPATPRARSAPAGCAARRPTHDLDWIRPSSPAWARWPGSSAGATRSWPSRFPTSPARWPGSGSRAACSRASTSSPSSGCWLPRAECRPICAGWRRPPRSPPRSPVRSPTRRSSAGWSSRSMPTAACSTPRAPHSPPRARAMQQARNRLIRRLDVAAPRTRFHRGRRGRHRHRARRALRHPGPPRLAEPARRHRARRIGSAGTLFVEPTEAIELGNALREAEVEEERETLRVLRELTAMLRPELADAPGRGRDVRRGG